MRRNTNRPTFLTLWQIRLPWSALASITHRVSGLFMALSIPMIILIMKASLESEQSYQRLDEALGTLTLVSLWLWGFTLALLYHIYAGIRHLLMDMNLFKSKELAEYSALFVFGLFALKGLFFTLWFWR